MGVLALADGTSDDSRGRDCVNRVPVWLVVYGVDLRTLSGAFASMLPMALPAPVLLWVLLLSPLLLLCRSACRVL